MDLKARKIVVISILVLTGLVPIFSFIFWNLTGGASERDEFLKQYKTDIEMLAALRGRKILWHHEGEDPMNVMKEQTSLVGKYKKDILKAFINSDGELESFFTGVVPEKDKKGCISNVGGFKTKYEEVVSREKNSQEMLEGLLRREGIYQDDKFVFEIIPAADLASSNVDEIRATQKKIWILQRIIYSMLKPASGQGRRPLVIQLLPQPGLNYAINVAFTAKEQEQQDNKKEAYGSKAAMFFEIKVNFRVIIDERNLQALLEQLHAYIPHDAGDESTIPTGIRESETPGGKLRGFAAVLGEENSFGDPKLNIIFRLKDIKIMRRLNADIVAKRGRPEVVDSEEEPVKVIEKYEKPLEVVFSYVVLDYNQHYNEKPPKK